MTGPRLKSQEFRREREASWRDLERLVSRVEAGGIRSLSPADLSRLPVLYRAALSSLSVARAISLDRNLLVYLETLSARAYVCVYAARRRLSDALADFFARSFPSAVRRRGAPVLFSMVAFLLGAVVAWVLVTRDADRFWSFVSPEMAQGRDPAASTDALRNALYSRRDATDQLVAFASFLFTNNARVGLLAFALGIAAGIPTFFLLFTNGMVLGAFGALYHSRGLGFELWAWLLPHGIPELTAVVLCGGAGFTIAQAVLFPGDRTRRQALAERGREAGVIVLGAVALLFVAGLVEGIFRQRVHDLGARYAVAIGMAVFVTWWLGFVGRAASGEAGASTGRGTGRGSGGSTP